MNERVIGFLDIGTNSVRILVVRLHPNYSYTVLSRQKELVRLGEGEFLGRGYLKRPAIDRTVIVCRHFADLARSFGADTIIAVTTSAAREARNRRILLDRLKEEADLDVQVVSGKEEARLIYLGVSSGIHLGEKQAIFIDIGGGSTEIVVGTQKQYHYLDSKKLGALRLSALFPPENPEGRISKKIYIAMRAYIDETLLGTIKALRTYRLDCAIGSSGTIENLADIASRVLHHGETRSQEAVLSRDDLRRVIALLRTRSVEERKKIPGMNPDRADIIIGGAAILESLMEALDIPQIHASERGLREGLLMDFLQREEGYFPIQEMSVRMISVLRLARLFRVDEGHANTTARLALMLFDSAREAGLHNLDDRQRELLEYAAILHDVGSYLSFDNHELHSYYLIRNGDLLGFNEEEVLMMANIARYHRKYLSPKQARNIEELDPEATRQVRIMANLLCLANSLDRSHTGVIQSARLVSLNHGEAQIELCALNGCDLELWGLGLHKKEFERIFHRTLHVIVNYSSCSVSVPSK
jgi:exopolyphosphatase/guanosine-5'-triphosphate,3'-diphosphate pyrophosphatase